MSFWLNMAKREFDDKPIAAQIYVTDQCNLDCWYCSEYDNSVPHPSLENLKKWIGKIAEIGCIRIGLQGGEPLLHPDIVKIVRFCKELNLRTSMSTNGFKLTQTLIEDLEEAGLNSLQISVDRVTPVESSRKSLKTIISKIELLKNSNLNFNITGVLFKDTLKEAKEVLEYGLSIDVPTHARLVHMGPTGQYEVETGARDALEDLLDFQIEEKKKGERIHSTSHLLDYQKSTLNGEHVDWTCIAGYKYFYVSAKGKFWLCCVNRTPNIDIMDVTPDLLKSYFHKKECQNGCGIYCIISESLAYNHPLRFATREVRDQLQSKAARLLKSVGHRFKSSPTPVS